MKTYKKGQKLISLTNDQGLECGKIYIFMGEEPLILPSMEGSFQTAKFLKVLDPSGEIHIIAERSGLFCDSWDTWSPEARKAALEARRRKAKMRGEKVKKTEGFTVKREPSSGIGGIHDLDENRIKSLQKYSSILDEGIIDYPLKEEDFLPKGKYERATMRAFNLKNRKELREYLEEDPGSIYELMDHEELFLKDLANKIDAENILYDKLKNEPSISKLTESDGRKKIRSMIREWEHDPEDNVNMIATQIVANGEFSIGGKMQQFASKNEEDFSKAEQLANSEFGEMQAKFLSTQYESTQEYLKKEGIDELVLYRGYKSPKGSEPESGHSVDVELQPLSSFSTDLPTAVDLAEIYEPSHTPSLVVATVKANRILSTPKTGYGSTDNREVVVLGGKVKATVYNGADKLKEIKKNCSNVSELLDKISI